MLFADQELRTKGLQAHGGTIAVNQGDLSATHGALVAPESDVVADNVSLDRGSQCAALFANGTGKTSPGCSDPQSFSSPLVSDFAAACGFPTEFPSCSPNVPITVDKNGSTTLTPGSYGELRVKNGGTVHLGEGTYVFCKITASRQARILSAAATIQVTGDVRLNNGASIGPDGAGVTENDVVLQVAGRAVHFSRQTRVTANVCAPNADLSFGDGGTHTGCFAAQTIQVSRAELTVCRSTTTTTTTLTGTTSTSTTTTVSTSTTTTDPCAGAHCGDGIVNCGEVCDPNAPPIPCGSATGAITDSSTGGFLQCISNCTVLDDSQCSTTTSTTGTSTTSTSSTIASTSSTTSTSTSTTTTDPCADACGNGVIDGQCGEVCDTGLAPTPCGSPQGAFITCVDNCTALDSSACTLSGTAPPTKSDHHHHK